MKRKKKKILIIAFITCLLAIGIYFFVNNDATIMRIRNKNAESKAFSTGKMTEEVRKPIYNK